MERDIQRIVSSCNKCPKEPGTVCVNSFRGRLVFKPAGTPLGSRLREPFEVIGRVAECPYLPKEEGKI